MPLNTLKSEIYALFQVSKTPKSTKPREARIHTKCDHGVKINAQKSEKSAKMMNVTVLLAGKKTEFTMSRESSVLELHTKEGV